MKIKSLHQHYDDYPNSLRSIFSPPEIIEVMGEFRSKNKNLAIIGSRKMTDYGKSVVKYLVSGLASTNLTIVSGLALGIDSQAHRSAINAKLHTIAVLPTDISNIYPRSHRYLASQILKNRGAIVSENNSPSSPRREDFLRRNRIIAGLSEAVLVIEANIRSGTTHTVNYALDAGIPVYVVPGSILNSSSKGTNYYLQQGAHPITCPEDLIYLLDLDKREAENSFDSDEILILTQLKNGPKSINLLAKNIKTDITKINLLLTKLELKNAIYIEDGFINLK